jgi:hypothetical protein
LGYQFIKGGVILNKFEVVLDDNRLLTSNEFLNLADKVNKGALPAEYFRKNLFNATTRISQELKRNKVIYDDGKLKIKVNRSLHQKHRDLLSIIFTDNKGVSKLRQDGSYLIYHNLYDMAKKMGYAKPNDVIHLIKSWLDDLRHTDMIIENESFEYGHMLLGDFVLDHKTNKYAIVMPAKTAKFHIMHYAVEIPKELNQKIVAIPNNLAKTKALVSYMLSNTALKNGISFENICDKLDINVSTRKSEFLREIKTNSDLLQEFNITFDTASQIIKYKQIEAIRFHPSLKIDKIIECIDKTPKEEVQKSSFESLSLFDEDELKEILDINEERYKKHILSFVSSEITINEEKYIFNGLTRDLNNHIQLEIKLNDSMCRANTQSTTYYAVFNTFFKDLM